MPSPSINKTENFPSVDGLKNQPQPKKKEKDDVVNKTCIVAFLSGVFTYLMTKSFVTSAAVAGAAAFGSYKYMTNHDQKNASDNIIRKTDDMVKGVKKAGERLRTFSHDVNDVITKGTAVFDVIKGLLGRVTKIFG